MPLAAGTIVTRAHEAGQPLLSSPWITHQTWHDLLFTHWPVSPAQIAPHLPPGLEVDTFADQAWVGVVPFTMRDVRPRGVPPVPGLSHFPELNLRTYATAQGRPGVFFFSLDAGNAIAVWLARSLFHLPYFDAHFRIRRDGEAIDYASQRTHRQAPAAAFAAIYSPTGPVFTALPGTLEYFLVERYCLYTTGRQGQLLRAEIRHLRWPLQPASATITAQTLTQAAGIDLPNMPPLLHFSRKQEVLVWRLALAQRGM